MTTYEHETPLRLLQDNPKFAEELFCGLLGQRLPVHTSVKPGSEAMTRRDEAVVRNCDNVAVYYEGDDPVTVLLFEVQRKRDKDKHASWLDYLASAYDRFRCPVYLVVITFDEKTEAWAREPVVYGHPGLVLIPLVIGPDLIPLITDPGQGRGNEPLMLLSLITYAAGEQGEAVMRAYYESIRHLDRESWSRYAEYALNALRGEQFMSLQEMIMSDTALPNTYRLGIFGEKYREGLAEGETKGKAEGKAEGERDLLLFYIDQRGIAASTAVRERIETCADPVQLREWAERLFLTDSTDHIEE